MPEMRKFTGEQVWVGGRSGCTAGLAGLEKPAPFQLRWSPCSCGGESGVGDTEKEAGGRNLRCRVTCWV